MASAAKEQQLTVTMALNQYRMGSKNLTSAVQSYAVTGDPQFYSDYMDELNVAMNREKAVLIMEEEGLEDSEWAMIDQIAALSNGLVPLEEEAMANVEKPHDQGVVAMVGVFIDTFVVLTMTALVVISCLYVGNGVLAGLSGDAYVAATSGADAIVSKTSAMQMAVGSVLSSSFGNMFVAICLLFFAFSTIIGWNFFGKVNVEYMFKNNKIATVIYSVIAIAFIFLGTLLSNNLVWELTDFFNYLMVLPNAIALIALYKLVVKASKK